MSPMSILIVDDDVDFADGMAEVLELDGHTVDIAYTRKGGVAAAGGKRYDAAMIDIVDQNKICIIIGGSAGQLKKIGFIGDLVGTDQCAAAFIVSVNGCRPTAKHHQHTKNRSFHIHNLPPI